MKFNLCIIGGGAGAFAAIIRANELKSKTVLINTGLPLGGTCVNVGCVPSKTLIHAAEILHLARHHGIPGIDLEINHFDFQKVIENELALVEKLREEKYAKVLKNLENITFLEGKAKFTTANEVEVNGKRISAEKFIIACGSTATIPPIEGIHDVGFLTHIEALKITQQPKELIVIGAGPLSLEFSQLYSRFGSKVTMLVRKPSIFTRAEKELTVQLTKILTNEGIDIRTDTEVKKAFAANGKKHLVYIRNGKEETISADEILLAIGKTPNTNGLGADKAGVEIDGNQAIVVDRFLKTSQQHIYALGDVTNQPLRLETTAGREGTLAVENALLGSKKSIDYHTVPYTIFTDPQLASIGLTEDAQMQTTGICACKTISFSDVPKAHILRRTEGLIKMVIEPNTKKILGVHILSRDGGELIAEAMALMRGNQTIDDVISALPVFPTMSEAFKIVALAFYKDVSKLSCCI
ncbi:MAG: mercury(II) reductase [Patescibacteria group bacterium]|nr:mercury(II) reductase [Patescibacteria group bacterium]